MPDDVKEFYDAEVDLVLPKPLTNNTLLKVLAPLTVTVDALMRRQVVAALGGRPNLERTRSKSF